MKHLQRSYAFTVQAIVFRRQRNHRNRLNRCLSCIICDVPSENKYTNLFTRKNTGISPGVHRDSLGFTGKFTGIHWEVHWDVPESFLGYGFLFSGFTGKSREVPVSLPRKIYRDIAMNSPVIHWSFTG